MPPQFEVGAKDRIRKGLEKYTNVLHVLQQAAHRGISEEDTSTIVQSMMVDLLGYDRFQEITGQYAVKGRWADWAVQVDDALYFFVEVRPLSAKLREKDLFQVVGYSRQKSLEWVILTTGGVWQCHRVPTGANTEQFFEIRILDSTQPVDEKIDYFYLLTKEGFSRGALHDRWARNECFRPEKLVKLLLSDDVLTPLRKCIHRDNPGKLVELGDLREALLRGVIRGDLPEVVQEGTESNGKKSGGRARTTED